MNKQEVGSLKVGDLVRNMKMDGYVGEVCHGAFIECGLSGVNVRIGMYIRWGGDKGHPVGIDHVDFTNIEKMG